MNTNSIAIRIGSTRTALVMWIPLRISSPNSIGSDNTKCTRLLATGTIGRIDAGPPDQCAIADNRAGRQIQGILKPAVDQQTGKEKSPEIGNVDLEDGTEH